MIHAEISIYPIGTANTSASFYIARGIESIQNISGLRHQVTAMGTILEAENMEKIFEATNKMLEAVHNLGVNRVEVMLKVDSRKDKHTKLEEKLDSINKQLKSF